MSASSSATPKLSDFKFLAFDVYATLIVCDPFVVDLIGLRARLQDWETGFYNALLPILNSYPVSSSWTRREALQALGSVEKDSFALLSITACAILMNPRDVRLASQKGGEAVGRTRKARIPIGDSN